MKIVPISQDFCPKQEMPWTEICTGKGRTTSVHYVYHYSWEKLPSFFPKVTCFFHYHNRKVLDSGILPVSNGEFVYELEIPAGTSVELFDNEVRLELTEKMIIREVTETPVYRGGNGIEEL